MKTLIITDGNAIYATLHQAGDISENELLHAAQRTLRVFRSATFKELRLLTANGEPAPRAQGQGHFSLIWDAYSVAGVILAETGITLTKPEADKLLSSAAAEAALDGEPLDERHITGAFKSRYGDATCHNF